MISTCDKKGAAMLAAATPKAMDQKYCMLNMQAAAAAAGNIELADR